MELAKTKILIIEDETIVSLDIKSAVLKLGFEVTDVVTSYDEAVQSIKENAPDIALVDINLENSKDGITTATTLKELADISIVYLSAFCDDETIKRAIETNPVGYLLKPFKRDELKSTLFLAQYKLQNKQNNLKQKACVDIGDNYCYDEINQNIYYKDKLISLTFNEKKLFYILYKSKNKIVPFETIEYEIWDDIVSSGALRTLLYRLRSKIEHKFIQTISKEGCMFQEI